MQFLDNQILTLFSLDLFRQIATNQDITILKVNAFITLLINYNIPFDTSYSTGTRRDSPGMKIVIYINPSSTLVLDVSFGGGVNAFNNNNP